MEKSIKKQTYAIHLQKSIKNWKFWVKLLIGTTQLLSIIIFLIVAAGVEGHIYAIPEHLSYFTTLSNIFCGIFFISSAFSPRLEGTGKFDNSEVAKIAVTYIMLTVIIYNINQIRSDQPFYFDTWKYVMTFICEHSVVPLLAIIYYLFFYNHQKAKNLKEFSVKWIWYMIIGLLLYLAVFSAIGFLAKFLNWKHLFGTIDGSNESSTFVYPFLDWYHGVAFFKNVPPWAECIIMLTATIFVAVVIDYSYTLIIIFLQKIKKQKGTLHSSTSTSIGTDWPFL